MILKCSLEYISRGLNALIVPYYWKEFLKASPPYNISLHLYSPICQFFFTIVLDIILWFYQEP